MFRCLRFHKPVDARAEGIEVVRQDLALCDNLTAAVTVIRICAQSTLKTKGLGFVR